jgi:hypothetical protein
MFVRFRKSSRRLDASLVETRRVGGKVRQEHVASLGSIAVPATVADRVAFWPRLHARLAALSNRIDAEAQAKIFGSVHTRIPMPTIDEQRALQLQNAKTDADRWNGIESLHAATAADHKGLIAFAERAIEKHEAEAANATAIANAAKDRIARLERGHHPRQLFLESFPPPLLRGRKGSTRRVTGGAMLKWILRHIPTVDAFSRLCGEA